MNFADFIFKILTVVIVIFFFISHAHDTIPTIALTQSSTWRQLSLFLLLSLLIYHLNFMITLQRTLRGCVKLESACILQLKLCLFFHELLFDHFLLFSHFVLPALLLLEFLLFFLVFDCCRYIYESFFCVF